MATVAIFGGGMAGLSAAHELVNRGFTVEVYELRTTLGGKSANQYPSDEFPKQYPAPTGGRDKLTGEHGFRFFPGFYHNVIATMDEIPLTAGGFVSERLTPSKYAGIAYANHVYAFPRQLNLPPWDVLSRLLELVGKMNFTATDLALMTWFRLKYLTSGPLRRLTYDDMSWRDFIGLDTQDYSDGCKEFEISIPRTMSAMAAEKTSAKIVGDITMQFLLGYGRPGNQEDRLLMGPTDSEWINPWRKSFDKKSVTFHSEQGLETLVYDSATQAITQAEVVDAGGTTTTVIADYYIAALPVEAMSVVVKSSGLDDPALDIEELRNIVAMAPTATSWMVGAQLYLKNDQPMVNGHVFYPQSQWALTSISQNQFWEQGGNAIETRFGDGKVKGIISAIISDWDTESPISHQTARQYTSRDVLLEEVRRQLQEHAPDYDLSPTNVAYMYLDTNVELTDPAVNHSPLLIHPVGGLKLRPGVSIKKIGNLFLAADYVRTSTELATMEGANEAARRAVNEILVLDKNPHVRCMVWELQEEPEFAPAQALDDLRCQQNRGHIMDSCPLSLLKDSVGLIDWLQAVLQTAAALNIP